MLLPEVPAPHFLAHPVACSRALGELWGRRDRSQIHPPATPWAGGGQRAAGGGRAGPFQAAGERPASAPGQAGRSLCRRAGRQHLQALGCQEKCTHPRPLAEG